MPNNYQVIDAYSSVLTFSSSIVSGAHQQIVQISSIIGPFPVQISTPSVSGTVGASIVGQLPAGTAILGSITALQGTNPWNISSVYGNISGSVVSFQGTNPWDVSGSVLSQQAGTRITSVISSNPSSMLVGSSIIGQLPAGTAVLGSVAVLQGTNPWNISSIYGNISGSVLAQQSGTRITSIVNSIPSSVIVGASMFGQLPAGTAVLGSVATLQGTNPWITTFSNPSILAVPTGSYITYLQSSSILAVPVGSTVVYLQSPSIVGTYAEDAGHTSADKGLFVLGVRNDAVASFVSADLEYNPFAHDAAGRTLVKPFAAEESRIEGYASTVNTSQTTLIGAAGTGLKNYITDLWFANTGAAATLVTLKDSLGSILGYTIAPAGSGSNLPGLHMPIRTGANATFDFQATTGTSVLYATVKGFKAP